MALELSRLSVTNDKGQIKMSVTESNLSVYIKKKKNLTVHRTSVSPCSITNIVTYWHPFLCQLAAWDLLYHASVLDFMATCKSEGP